MKNVQRKDEKETENVPLIFLNERIDYFLCTFPNYPVRTS